MRLVRSSENLMVALVWVRWQSVVCNFSGLLDMVSQGGGWQHVRIVEREGRVEIEEVKITVCFCDPVTAMVVETDWFRTFAVLIIAVVVVAVGNRADS